MHPVPSKKAFYHFFRSSMDAGSRPSYARRKKRTRNTTTIASGQSAALAKEKSGDILAISLQEKRCKSYLTTALCTLASLLDVAIAT